MTRKHPSFLLYLFLAGSLLSNASAFSDTGAIAVLYPEIEEPHRSKFESIIQGIEHTTKVKPTLHPINPEINAVAIGALKHQLAEEKIRGIIALGKHGLEIAQQMNWSGPLVVGAVIWDSTTPVSGISLDPDPRILFGNLRRLTARIKRVHVVSDPSQSGWIMERAKVAASESNLTLLVHKASSRRAALQLYDEVFSNLNSDQDAVWLPIDSTTVDDDTVLPLVLRAAWNNKVTVFSSTPVHAERGVLFSVYPDYLILGRRLATALDKTPTPTLGMSPTSDLRLAVNLRTARHLSLHFNQSQQDKFDMVFQ